MHSDLNSILKKLPRPIGILGFGVEGQSTARFLLRHNLGPVLVFDRQQPKAGTLPKGCNYAAYEPGASYLSRLSEVACLFRSAGIRADLPELQKWQNNGGILTSQIQLFFDLVPRERIIGVTGTLGKGTCCALLEKILLEAKVPCKMGGNFGLAALDLLEDLIISSENATEESSSSTNVLVVKASNEIPWMILELSSFQLSTLHKSPAYSIVLKTTVEHLDWHLDQTEYWQHKANLVRFQRETDLLIYAGDIEGSSWIASQSPARKQSFAHQSLAKEPEKPDIEIRESQFEWEKYSVTLKASELKTKGLFNLENMAAATLLADEIISFKPDSDHLILKGKAHTILQSCRDFAGLEHRLEFVREIDRGLGKLRFYNDSYATRPEATIGAIGSFSGESIGLILGGSDKGVDFSSLAQALISHENLQAVALIGQTAASLEKAIRKQASACGLLRFTLEQHENLEMAMNSLLQKIETGSILLSPACASFGLFANYKERGWRFKALVDQL